MHRRRHLLGGGAAAALTLPLLLPTLAGCGTRAPAPPPPPPQPIRRLLVLPAGWTSPGEGPGAGNSGFGAAPAPVFIYGGVSRGRSSSSQGSGGPNPAAVVGVALLAGLVVWGLAENRKREAQALAEALAEVAFDPQRHLSEKLAPALQARGVAISALADAELARSVRSQGLAALGQIGPAGAAGAAGTAAADADAWLDVRVEESGFYNSMRAGGFSPMLQVVATLRAPDGRALDSYSYYGDWREGGRDRRWVTTPRALTYASTGALRDDAAAVRAGLAQLVERFVELIAEDVQRHAAGQARID